MADFSALTHGKSYGNIEKSAQKTVILSKSIVYRWSVFLLKGQSKYVS